MRGWQALTEAALRETQHELDELSEAELLRESSDSESDPSVVPTSSQTSDDPCLE